MGLGLPDHQRPPDLLEKVFRFVCGGLLGSFVGLLLVVKLFRPLYRWGALSPSVPFYVAVIGASVLVFGLAAMKFGDRLWEGLGNAVVERRWWWPW
jgi:hypothetical protein